jgi:hypothetical protein
MYTFSPTKDATGISTTISIMDKKVVITSYNTQTLLIQGPGCRIWRNTIFKTLSATLENELDNDKPTEKSKSPIGTKLKEKSKSRSLLNSVTTKLFGPPIDKELLKMAKEMKKTDKKKGRSPVNREYLSKCLKEAQSSHLVTKGSRPVNFQPKNSTPLNRVGSTPLNSKYNQYMPSTDEHNTKANSKCSSPTIENIFNNTEQTKVKQLIDTTETKSVSPINSNFKKKPSKFH